MCITPSLFMLGLDVARIKLCNNYSRLPPSILKHHTFNKWKKYILLNGGNINECKHLKNRQIGRDESFKLDKNIFNFDLTVLNAQKPMENNKKIEHRKPTPKKLKYKKPTVHEKKTVVVQ